MRVPSLVSSALAICAATRAYADELPLRLIDRPLALPPGNLEPYVGLGVLHFPNAASPAPSNIEIAELALDAGIAPRLEAGAFAQFEAGPASQILVALGSVQYQLLQFAAIRFDGGVQRVDNGDIYGAIGVGLPLRLKLTDSVALISSRPYAWSAEDDLVSVRLSSGSDILEIRVPAGILIQIDPHFSLALRSGFRLQGSATYIPVGVDAVASFGPIDAGVILDLSGQIGPANGTSYDDIFTARVFAQLRL